MDPKKCYEWFTGLLKPHDQQIEHPPSTTPNVQKQAGYPSQTKLGEDERPQYQKQYTVKDNEVNENKGNGNGTFAVGDTSISKEHDKPQYKKNYVVSGNKVNRNEGHGNGAFIVGDQEVYDPLYRQSKHSA